LGAVTGVTTADIAAPRASVRRSAEVRPTDPARRGGWPADVGIVGSLTTVVVISVLRHEMWRDEIQAWSIAIGSRSVGDLFGALRYEGHPPLWHLLLMPITRATSDPRTMQVIAVACFVATAILVVRLSPWPRWIQVAVLAGYFPLFEFTVIARSYALGMPLTFLLLVIAWPRRRDRSYPLIALLAVLLALTSAADALVAVGIVLGVLVDELRLSSGNGAQWSRLRRPALLSSMAAAALSVAIVAYFVRPAADVIISSGQSTRISTRVGGELARAIVPVSDVRPTWWGSSWTVNQLGTTTAGLVGAVVFGVAVWSVRRSIPGLVTLLTTTVLVLGLGALTGQTALHMGGHILVSVVAASWVYFRGEHRSGKDAAEQALADRSHVRFLAVVLGLQLLGTAVVLPQAWTTRFSGLEGAVRRLRTVPVGTMIAVEPEALAGGVAGMIGHPVWVPSTARDQWYAVWDHLGSSKIANQLRDDETVARVRARAGGKPAVLVLDHRFRGVPGSVHLISAVTPSVVNSENVYAYVVLPPPASR